MVGRPGAAGLPPNVSQRSSWPSRQIGESLRVVTKNSGPCRNRNRSSFGESELVLFWELAVLRQPPRKGSLFGAAGSENPKSCQRPGVMQTEMKPHSFQFTSKSPAWSAGWTLGLAETRRPPETGDWGRLRCRGRERRRDQVVIVDKNCVFADAVAFDKRDVPVFEIAVLTAASVIRADPAVERGLIRNQNHI